MGGHGVGEVYGVRGMEWETESGGAGEGWRGPG